MNGHIDHDIQVDRIDVSSVQPSALTNTGLLIATLKVENKEIMDLKLVVSVLKNDGGELMRCIYSPLD
jgi:hypothetical protein